MIQEVQKKCSGAWNKAQLRDVLSQHNYNLGNTPLNFLHLNIYSIEKNFNVGICPALSLSMYVGVLYDNDPAGPKYLANTSATFYCSLGSGTYLSATLSRTCQPSGIWNGTTPICRGNDVCFLFCNGVH